MRIINTKANVSARHQASPRELRMRQQKYLYIELECGRESNLKPNDAVKCTFCAYRILYKKRNINLKEPVQYEAIWYASLHLCCYLYLFNLIIKVQLAFIKNQWYLRLRRKWSLDKGRCLSQLVFRPISRRRIASAFSFKLDRWRAFLTNGLLELAASTITLLSLRLDLQGQLSNHNMWWLFRSFCFWRSLDSLLCCLVRNCEKKLAPFSKEMVYPKYQSFAKSLGISWRYQTEHDRISCWSFSSTQHFAWKLSNFLSWNSEEPTR